VLVTSRGADPKIDTSPSIVGTIAEFNVVRDGTVIHETSIAQLRRFKDDAREVLEGFDCGISLEGYNDLKEKDGLECYEVEDAGDKDKTDKE